MTNFAKDASGSKFLIKNSFDWVNLLEKLDTGAIFVARIDTDGNNFPREYPVLAKITETVVIDDDDQDVPAYFVVLFYKDEACELLGIDRTGIKDYTYAQAI